MPHNLVLDQKEFWTSPLRLRAWDTQWLLPLTMGTALVVGNDRGIEQHLPSSPSVIDRSRQASNLGVAALAGASAGTYFFGHWRNDNKLRETGFLSGEAFINTFLITSAVKLVTGRERPGVDGGRGEFWNGGDSFPSQHAAVAWSMATVLANEYPGPMTKLLAYGTAAAVTATRVTGQRHFASDALIGSALGWYVGRQVYRARGTGAQWDNARWGTFTKTEKIHGPEDLSSPYVPLDSWVYPAFDRLAARGYMPGAYSGLRPWTRLECARLLNEIGKLLPADNDGDAARIFRTLSGEFDAESRMLEGGDGREVRLDSIYTRYTGIAGAPLNDSYHFGQTIINDYGRPYAEGSNVISGASGWASVGPLTLYMTGEYEHAPAQPAYSDSVRQLIADVDLTPVQPPATSVPTNQFRLLDSYLAWTIKGVQFSVGRQSLWWGPGRGGPLLFSDNAEPMEMFRINKVSPWKVPLLSRILGPMRWDGFLGRLEGHHFPSDPWIHAQKLSFKPTPNLELGFSRSVVFAGHGFPLTSPHPFTFLNFWHSFMSVGDNKSSVPGANTDVGDRRGGFDFSYRVPGLRKWLVLYNDSFVDDDTSPLYAPQRAAMHPGIYLPQIPKISKLDFRAEAVYTNAPGLPPHGPGRYFYWNWGYRDSHQNNGNIMGSWVGRQGQGLQVWSKYWFSAQNTIELGSRFMTLDHEFIPGGGNLRDIAARAHWNLPSGVELATSLQLETWNIPVLSPKRNTNAVASVQLTYHPFSSTKGKQSSRSARHLRGD